MRIGPHRPPSSFLRAPPFLTGVLKMLSDDYGKVHMPALGERLFGSATRTPVLMALAALGESYPREISEMIGKPLISIQRILADLGEQGIVQSRLRRNVRLTTFAEGRISLELKNFLLVIIAANELMNDCVTTLRPRAGTQERRI